jgi:quercetin dioxygenase-like cupin family protein
MNGPEIKIISLSNVFTKSMHFVKKGDVMQGHTHTYDHATLVSAGSALVEMLDDNLNIVSAKTFMAPEMIYVPKDKIHRITALEDNTVCACIHALRTIDEEIINPDSFTEPVTDFEITKQLILEKNGIPFRPLLQKNLPEENK